MTIPCLGISFFSISSVDLILGIVAQEKVALNWFLMSNGWMPVPYADGFQSGFSVRNLARHEMTGLHIPVWVSPALLTFSVFANRDLLVLPGCYEALQRLFPVKAGPCEASKTKDIYMSWHLESHEVIVHGKTTQMPLLQRHQHNNPLSRRIA